MKNESPAFICIPVSVGVQGFVCSSWLFGDQWRDRYFSVVSKSAERSIVLELLVNGEESGILSQPHIIVLDSWHPIWFVRTPWFLVRGKSLCSHFILQFCVLVTLVPSKEIHYGKSPLAGAQITHTHTICGVRCAYSVK